MKSYRCNNCGSGIMINDENVFSKCIYCGSSVTLIKKEYSDFNIQKIIPFRNTEQEALDYLTKYVGSARMKDVVDVKRVYIPVRFCSYDFNYLCSYDRVESDGDGGTNHYPTDGLIDGTVYKEAYLETNIMGSILGFHDLRGIERFDFDPVRLGNISCEFSDDMQDDKIIKKMHANVKAFGKSFFKKPNITNITNINHYINNIDIENYTTLVPVYLIKTMGGGNFAVSGTITYRVDSKPKVEIDAKMLLAILVVMSGFCFLPLLPIGIILFVSQNKGINQKNNFEFEDNIKYKVYNENRKAREFIHFNLK